MSNLIRGGQLTIHSARMLGQVFRIMLILFLCFTAPQIGYRMWQNYEDQKVEYNFGITYLKANFKFLAKDDDVFEYKDVYGTERRTTIGIAKARFKPSYDGIIDDLKVSAFWASIYSSIVLVFIGAYFVYRGASVQERKRIRGGEIATAKELDKQALSSYTRKDKRRYSLAGVHWPKDGETLHTIIVGSTGAGKTVAMSALVEQIESYGDKAIIYDKMGSFVPYFYRPERDFILNPYDGRSHDWDIFHEAQHEVDFESMAAALIPTFKDVADPFWQQAARILFASGARAMWKQGDHDMRVLCDLLIKSDLKELAQLMVKTEAQAIVDPEQSKTALSVRSMLSANIRPLSMLPSVKNPFSVREWVQDGKPGFLFLGSEASTHETRRAMISTQIELAIIALQSMEPSNDRRVWFIIDELPTLQQIPSLSSGLRESRQFGGAFVIGTQVMSELRAIYGREEAETLSGNCNTRLVLSSPDAQTAEWLSNSLGKAMMERRKEGYSFGASEHRDGVNVTMHEEITPLVLPSELQNLEKLHGYLKMPRELPVARILLKPKQRVKIGEIRVPNTRQDEEESEDLAIDALTADADVLEKAAWGEKPDAEVPEDIPFTHDDPAPEPVMGNGGAPMAARVSSEDVPVHVPEILDRDNWAGETPTGPPAYVTDVPPPEKAPLGPGTKKAKKKPADTTTQTSIAFPIGQDQNDDLDSGDNPTEEQKIANETAMQGGKHEPGFVAQHPEGAGNKGSGKGSGKGAGKKAGNGKGGNGKVAGSKKGASKGKKTDAGPPKGNRGNVPVDSGSNSNVWKKVV